MPYEIVVHELAIVELETLRAFDRRRVIAEIRKQLTEQPAVLTRQRKCLVDLTPSFDHELPVWELRIGEFRVFYDVQEDEQLVHVRAVRRKGPWQRTEDIV
jgi:mRNA-degrading endonuclease RelE of RelBE toxin-antitoxin system